MILSIHIHFTQTVRIMQGLKRKNHRKVTKDYKQICETAPKQNKTASIGHIYYGNTESV